jgi:hypothetical protein
VGFLSSVFGCKVTGNYLTEDLANAGNGTAVAGLEGPPAQLGIITGNCPPIRGSPASWAKGGLEAIGKNPLRPQFGPSELMQKGRPLSSADGNFKFEYKP